MNSLLTSLTCIWDAAKGTIEYLAPEVVLCSYSNKYEGRPSDTWACGVMLCVKHILLLRTCLQTVVDCI